MPHTAKDFKIEKAAKQKTLEQIEKAELSTFQGAKPLKYDTEKQDRLKNELFEEFEAIKRERDDEKLDAFFDEKDNQYDGIMPRRAGQQFNLDSGFTKEKENDIVRSIMEAHWGVDPIVSVGPRPEYSREGGMQICQKQEEFLDYSFDSKIPFRHPFRLAAHSATRKKVGIIKWIHKIRMEPKTREETYKPEFEDRPDPNQEGAAIRVNKGVENFMRAHRERIEKDPEKYQWVINQLNRNQPVTIDVEYSEPVYNDPFPKFVNNKNFYVRLNTEGYEGLITTRLTVERVSLTYYELKAFEKEYNFVNVDKLLYENDEDEADNKVREGAYSRKYDILECVFNFNETNESDADLQRIVCFFSEDKQIFLGGVYFPLVILQCYYVPHYIKKNKEGFYQGCIAEDLRDIHIAKNALLNFTLEGAWATNTVTPITPEDSPVDVQFANKEFMHGIPLNARKDEVDFLNAYMKPTDIAGLMTLDGNLSRIGGALSGVSDLRTGREAPLDPNAPGNKTIALLQQSGINIEDYVKEMSQGFNLDASCVLKLYYEISQNDLHYIRHRSIRVTGVDVFATIAKSDLIAKTTIQSQAHAFDLDKLNAKREDIALYQLIRPEALVAGNPEAVWTLLRNIAKNWSQKWRNQINIILPSLEQLKAKQAELAVVAVQQYVQGVLEEAKNTKQEPQFDPMKLIAVVAQLQKELVSPTPPEGQGKGAK